MLNLNLPAAGRSGDHVLNVSRPPCHIRTEMLRMDLHSAVHAREVVLELPNVRHSKRTGRGHRSRRHPGDGAQDQTIVEHLNRTDKSASLGSTFVPVHG